MTSKDKPTRGKPSFSGRDKKTFGASSKPGGAKPYRKGPPKEARADSDETRSERPKSDRPRAERSFGDKPRGEKTFGDKPKGDRKFGDKPKGERSFGDKPRGEKSFGDKPRGERSFGDKPREGKSFGDKPAGARSFGGKPGAGAPRSPSRPPRVVSDAAAVEEGGLKPERISKLLARAGVASRRDVERMIMDGRVRLNGVTLDTPVVLATLADRIEVDGQPIRGIERTRLWLYHKPAGLVTTNADPEGRPTVFDALPEDLPRVMSIGRLDINTEGLLLLTNDGGLARVLELPSTGWLRRYRVRAHGDIDQPALDKLKEGIAVDGVLYGGIDATLDRKQGHNVWLTMGLREGKNREIKNVLGALGLDVNRLIRLSYGPFQLGDLDEGGVIEVRGRMLREQLGPRLIEDAKANFDAPIYNSTPKASDEEDEADARPAAKASARPERSERPERSGRPRSEAPRGDKPRGGKSFDKPSFGKGRDRDREEEPEFKPKRKTPGSSRTANVWMAPGAKPVGEKEAARRKKIPTPNARPMVASPDTKGPRVTVTRAAEDNDWIRAESFGGKEEEDKGGFGRKRSFGDKPRGDRKFDDKPRGERSFGDKPHGERKFDDKPRGERKFGDKPAGKSFGGKPSGGKSFGGKPGGGRSGGAGFGGGRPSGGKPGGSRKPRG